MTTTILLVGHGSRNQAGNDEIRQFQQQWQAQHPDWRIELCYIELADVLLPEGLQRAAQGSDRVIVVPLIISAAGHVKMEIPEHIEEARENFPAVEFIYAPHLGSNETLLAILQKQLKTALKSLAMPDPKTTGVIILGRGSSDKAANGELAKLARWLFEATEHELVDIAFTGITHPRLETAVQRQVRLGMTQIAILPYYLFTGLLIERIGKQVERLQSQYPQIAFGAGTYFGFDPAIFKLLDQRVTEACDPVAPKMLECDGCQYREQAEHHHHHQ
ncbi:MULTISPECIES: sirohydrochlorin chelatase [Methylomonas]|uniref:Cobalamin biosynthesis protein CbiX n=2 Tax=Methylomonas TaxID=416 RepID=A0A126T3G2_9GAMM|nr:MULTISPECIES: sirohydrochlorin chelatase [Methylomonas]AMK76617.1 cobalamin biosynthesis protein CbiX [Methylomonas denitrificans]OAH97727.1 cobalamin biosynthesis protein CbiX [Methylomonas methanica]TCV72486.1 sirohydrochlorin cobaltochelatase [Methylomonas methanica]